MHKIAIGTSDFRKLREMGAYFVDKSHFIGDIWRDAKEVLLFPRPRRFGKTVNLSMLRYFFEKSEEDRRPLFQDLSIAHDTDVMVHQGRYPTIFLTFKGLKTEGWGICRSKAYHLISGLFDGYRYLLEEECLSEMETRRFQHILDETADQADYEASLAMLMGALRRCHGQQVVVLIDEYDTPIHAGCQNGWYKQITAFMRNLLGEVFKDNPDLKKGVLTGILRVAKESIFSGLNNMSVYSLLRPGFSTAFGLTEKEVETALTHFKRRDLLHKTREWYNGYLFGNQVVYNPWSVLNLLADEANTFDTWWIHTSGNDLIRDLIMGSNIRADLETLLVGGVITKYLNEQVSFRDLDKTPDNIWSLFTFSGYLKVAGCLGEDADRQYQLTIPNLEVRIFFSRTVAAWTRSLFGEQRLSTALAALASGNIKDFGKIFRDIVRASLSYHDLAAEPESFYHAFVLGMLVALEDRYFLRSNRESGYGRYDVVMEPKTQQNPGLVLEFKKIDTDEETNWEAAMESALKQISEKDYARDLRDRGVSTILGVGIVFEGKNVRVRQLNL